MAISVKVGEAKTRLSELLAKVEAGEEVVIARGDEPVAKLVRLHRRRDVERAVAAIRSARTGRGPTTDAELSAWRDEGKRR